MKGQIGIPASYFLKMAKADYNDYSEALPREFYQNSIDAGATEINVDFDENNQIIKVTDDGVGMSRDIILNKLLVLGGSHKEDGNVGAFGKAKEILFFSWARYRIETRNHVVEGKGAEFTLSEAENYVNGTICTIWIPKDFDKYNSFMSLIHSFRLIAERTETDTIIYINGQTIRCELQRGKMVNDLGWAKLYYKEGVASNSRAQFRIQGMWMFDSYVSGLDKVGQIIVELSASSIDCLTSNRDNLKSDYKNEANKLIQKLVGDREAILNPQPNTLREKITGKGSIDVFKEAMLRQIEKSPDVLESILTFAKSNIDKARFITEFKDIDVDKLYDYIDRLSFIGYEPDFIVKRPDDVEVSKFMKTKRALIYAKMWTEVCKQVMLDNNIHTSFTAGFIFSKNLEAQYEKHEGTHCIYINPDFVGNLGNVSGLSNRRIIVQDMLEKALHEVTHLVGCDWHDETFVGRMSKLRGGTFKSASLYKKIEGIKG